MRLIILTMGKSRQQRSLQPSEAADMCGQLLSTEESEGLVEFHVYRFVTLLVGFPDDNRMSCEGETAM